jgi:alpha-glucan,water dikinase
VPALGARRLFVGGRRPGAAPPAPRARPAALAVSAVAEAPAAGATAVYERTYPLPSGFSFTVATSELQGGDQEVALSTDAPGRLLLHWGVEGGRGYRGGWRLPDGAARPEGTVEYKKRALQTPFVPPAAGGAAQTLRIRLAGAEASDFLNFVLKDAAADAWYDLNGANYQVPLRAALVGTPSASDVLRSVDSDDEDAAAAVLLPLDQVPPVPQDLAGVWAYMRWEAAGCPQRSREEGDAEYRVAVAELTALLQRGAHLDLLRSVADAGVVRYTTFVAEFETAWRGAGAGKAAPRAAAAPPPAAAAADAVPAVPEDLVGVKAYQLWEAAGRPDGADFAAAARAALAEVLRGGASVEELRAQMQAPALKQQQQQAAAAAPPPPQREAQQAAPPPPPPPPPPQEVHVGEGRGMRERNPLDLVNRAAAPRLAERARPRETPLGPLVRAAGEDEHCVWSRVSAAAVECALRASCAACMPSRRPKRSSTLGWAGLQPPPPPPRRPPAGLRHGLQVAAAGGRLRGGPCRPLLALAAGADHRPALPRGAALGRQGRGARVRLAPPRRRAGAARQRAAGGGHRRGDALRRVRRGGVRGGDRRGGGAAAARAGGAAARARPHRAHLRHPQRGR